MAEVVGIAGSSWARRWPSLVGIALLVLAPYAILESTWSETKYETWRTEDWSLFALRLFSQWCAIALLAPLVYDTVAGITRSRSAALRDGLRQLGGALGPAMAQMLVETLYLGSLFGLVTLSRDFCAGALVMFGATPVGVVLAFFHARWFVAVPAAGLEGLGAAEALRRSTRLTRGRVGGTTVVWALLTGGTAQLLLWVRVATVDRVEPWVVPFIVLPVLAALTALEVALRTTAYHELRRVVEGRDPRTVAAVFD